MLIRTRLRLAALFPAVFALVIAVVLWTAAIKVDHAQSEAELAEEASRFNFELSVLTQEYVLYGGERAHSQLLARHRSLGEVLAGLEPDNPEETELLAAARRNHRDIAAFYRHLFDGRTLERDQVAGSLLVFAQDMRTKVRRFADIRRNQVVETQRTADAIIFATVAVSGALSTTLLLLMTGEVTRGVRRLDEGMARVTAGDLGHGIEVYSADELGALARSFNVMAKRLSESYSSNERLMDEVARRHRAEAAIRQLNAELDARVQRRTAELEAANKELEAFSYSVSHDLRVPLRAIDGFSRILLAEYHDKLDAEGQRFLAIVRSSTERMAQLIDDILRFSRAGRVEMNLALVDMDALARSVVEELGPTAEGRDLTIDIAPLPAATGDRAMLRQVFANLLSNAIKFTGPKETATIRIDGERVDAESVYRVTDDGVGFDPRYADKLFGVFQRLHGIEEFEGTGIGLAIVKRIVLRHGGRVWAEGEVDRGATFYFALPAQGGSP